MVKECQGTQCCQHDLMMRMIMMIYISTDEKNTILICVHVYKVKLATLVEGDLKASFSIATTLRCRGGCYSISRIAPLYPWSSPYKAASSTIFWVFGMIRPGIQPQSSGPLANTLLIRPMAECVCQWSGRPRLALSIIR